jgi:hypothetical protein
MDGMEETMNWLAEYFSRRTPVLNISMWAYPPLLLGPEGPVAQKPHCLPYPGVELAFSAGDEVRRGALTFEIPARYELRQTAFSRAGEAAPGADGPGFFRTITILAPSRYSRDVLITVNDTFAFVPVFSTDGAPGFFGSCIAQPDDSTSSQQMRFPWCFQGYISI